MNAALQQKNQQYQQNSLELVSRAYFSNRVDYAAKPILELQNLSVSFTQYTNDQQQKEWPVISNLNITIYPGEIVTVAGSNESGKSLIADTILGILPENANIRGSLRYKGQAISRGIQNQLREEVIAVNYLTPLMRLGNQLDYSVKWSSSKQLKEIVFNHYIMNTGIEYLLVPELSASISRRVSLSSVLQSNTQLIIAEEPTNGFNPLVLNEVLNHFSKLADAGHSILLITNDVNIAFAEKRCQ